MSTISASALLEQFTKQQIPFHCQFELTYSCNLKCLHCYIVRQKNKKEISKVQAFDIIRQLKEAGTLVITFTGGEIFTRKDFFQIASYAKKLNFALRFSTNGTLVDKKVARRIRSLEPLSVELSLYGFKRTHEVITQVKGSFERTLSAIRALLENNIKVVVKSPALKQNVESIFKIQEFVEKDLGAQWLGTGGGLFISACDDGNTRPLRYRLSDDVLRVYMQELFVRSKAQKQKKYWPRQIKENEELCSAGFSLCNVTPYGELNPCMQIRFKNNNIQLSSLKEIWNQHTAFNEFRELRLKDRKDCLTCELIAYCEMCAGNALLECGSFTAKLPEACRQARIRKEICGAFYKNA